MEQEQSNLGSVNVSDESILSGENPVEGSYVVDDRAEIMVEIVGSDVFLDGIKPENERVVPQNLEVKCSESDEVCEVSAQQDLDVKYSESDEVREVSAQGNETVVNNSTKVPVEAVVVGEISGAEEIKDDAIDDKCASANIVTNDQLNDVFLDGMRPTNERSNCVVPQDLEVKCSESYEISTLGNQTADNNCTKVLVEAVVVGEIEGAEGIKDGAMDDEDASANIVTNEQLNDAVEALAEVESEAAEKNSPNDQNNEISQVRVADEDKPSGNVEGIVDNGNDPVEVAVVVGEIGDTEVKGIKDEAIADKGACENIATYGQLNDSVEARAEGETGIDMVVTEESTVKSEAAENNSSNDQSNEISHVEVADADKPSGNGEGVDMEHFEQHGNAHIQELLAHAETVCPLAYDGEKQLAEINPGVDSEIEPNDLVEENGSPRSKESEVVSLQKTEMEHDGVDMPENIEVATSNDEINKSRESEEHDGVDMPEHIEVATSNDEINKSRESEDDSSKNNENPSSEARLVDTDNQLAESNPGVEAEIGIENLVEENGFPQNKELGDSLLKGETEQDGIDMSDNIEVAFSNDEINKCIESEEGSGKNHGSHFSETRLEDVEMETELYQNYHQEDSSKSHENRSSETLLVDEGKETELYQEYHQEEEVDAEIEQISDEVVSSHKRKALDSLTDGPDKRGNFDAANISTSTDQTPKPSFKIGECIRRVASQLTGGTSMVVNEISAESSSVTNILSQLQIVAQNPSKPHKFRDEIRTFFSGFRSSVVASKRVRKRKSDLSEGGPGEEFEFDDAQDSYWTDMIVQNNPEQQTLHDNENGEGRIQLAVPVNGEKPEKSGRKPQQSRKKRYFTGHIPPNTADESEEKAKRMKQATSPAELILNFAERKCVPSEIKLNKMFRRFGPLMESETEVDYESGRARVIFKRGSDAEVAHSSSQKFSIFGPELINYQIGYSPLISVKVSPLQIT